LTADFRLNIWDEINICCWNSCRNPHSEVRNCYSISSKSIFFRLVITRSLLSAWVSICRTRSRVIPNSLPMRSSVFGSPSPRPNRSSTTFRSLTESC